MLTENDSVMVAICTPIMRRAHLMLQSSNEICILDAAGNMDLQNHLPTRKRKAPHNLEDCVYSNKSLGRKCNAK